MAQTVFEIDGDNFADFDGFVVEFNRGFVSHVGGNWRGNFDAFNDYLSWYETGRCTIRWRNSRKSRAALGSTFELLLNIMRDNTEFVDVVLD